jgi:proteasome-associated ATPase
VNRDNGKVEEQSCREVRLVAGREDSHDGQTSGSRADDRADARQLQAQLGLLEEEISMLRRKLTESPRSVHLLEERLADAQASLAGVTGQNERLVTTLKEAREQIIALREEVDRLAQPPSGYGVFLARHAASCESP